MQLSDEPRCNGKRRTQLPLTTEVKDWLVFARDSQYHAAMQTDQELLSLEEMLGYSFQDRSLLRRALIHGSYLSECGDPDLQSNERLEFLGDAVVDLAVGHLLMERLPHAREGELSKLRAMVVREASLAVCARSLALGDYLILGKGEEQTGGRNKPSILSDAFEAVMGAIFLDNCFDEADRVLRRIIGGLVDDAVKGELDQDHKSRLKELAEKDLREMPRYEVVDEWGPAHAKMFRVAVFLGDREIARAEGPSKKAAEQQAARRALRGLL